jgi:hypothetical protein
MANHLTNPIEDVVRVIERDYGAVVRYDDERFHFHVPSGKQSSMVEGWVDGEWLHLHEHVAPLDALGDDQLIACLKTNEAPSRCRLGSEGNLIVVRADFPMHLYPASDVLDVLRAIHAEASRLLSVSGGRR